MNVHEAILIILEDRVGRDNRISRVDLRCSVAGELGYHIHTITDDDGSVHYETELSDREMRQAIKDVREQGHLICSTSADGGGYWMAGHPGEAKDMKLDYRKRALSCLMTAGKIEKSARARFGDQMTLDLETG